MAGKTFLPPASLLDTRNFCVHPKCKWSAVPVTSEHASQTGWCDAFISGRRMFFYADYALTVDIRWWDRESGRNKIRV